MKSCSVSEGQIYPKIEAVPSSALLIIITINRWGLNTIMLQNNLNSSACFIVFWCSIRKIEICAKHVLEFSNWKYYTSIDFLFLFFIIKPNTLLALPFNYLYHWQEPTRHNLENHSSATPSYDQKMIIGYTGNQPTSYTGNQPTSYTINKAITYLGNQPTSYTAYQPTSYTSNSRPYQAGSYTGSGTRTKTLQEITLRN